MNTQVTEGAIGRSRMEFTFSQCELPQEQMLGTASLLQRRSFHKPHSRGTKNQEVDGRSCHVLCVRVNSSSHSACRLGAQSCLHVCCLRYTIPLKTPSCKPLIYTSNAEPLFSRRPHDIHVSHVILLIHPLNQNISFVSFFFLSSVLLPCQTIEHHSWPERRNYLRQRDTSFETMYELL